MRPLVKPIFFENKFFRIRIQKDHQRMVTTPQRASVFHSGWGLAKMRTYRGLSVCLSVCPSIKNPSFTMSHINLLFFSFRSPSKPSKTSSLNVWRPIQHFLTSTFWKFANGPTTISRWTTRERRMNDTNFFSILTPCFFFIKAASRNLWLLSLRSPYRSSYKQHSSQKKQRLAYRPTGLPKQRFFQQIPHRFRSGRQSFDQS